MKYIGSKSRISKKILPLILTNKTYNQFYVEPFVGGGNMIQHVEGNRIGADFNEHVIHALKMIRDSPYLIPKNNLEFTEEDYRDCKTNRHDNLWGLDITSFAGFTYSFGAKFFGGWARCNTIEKRDYVAQAYRSALKQSPKLKNVELHNVSYDELEIPEKSIIYCDPPYFNTYSYGMGFNHENFWQWCRDKVEQGHEVFVSEQKAPEDFMSIFERQIKNQLSNSKKLNEQLYIHESQF